MKKFFTILLVIALAVTFALTFSACSDENFTVTFDLNGGTYRKSTENVTVSRKSISQAKAPAATYEGYTFVGWTVKEDGTGDAVTFPYTPTADVTLYAQWALRSDYYMFSFEVGDLGSDIAPIVNKGTLETAPVSTRLGHYLEGWYTDSAHLETTKVTFPYKAPQQKVTLYANWEANSVKINFESNGGSDIDAIEGEYNTLVNAPSEPTKDGFVFAGWYSDAAFKTAYTFSRLPAADITLYARWVNPASQLEFVEINNGAEYAVKGVGEFTEDFCPIPATFNGKPVTKILADAFSTARTITTIKVPSSVVEIEKGAFAGIYGLEEIELPFIGKSATATEPAERLFGYIFGDKEYPVSYQAAQNYADGKKDFAVYYIPTSLKKVSIVNAASLAYGAFCNVRTLTDVTLGNASGSMGDYSFYGCASLTTITIGDEVTSLGKYAFGNCFALTKVTISADSKLTSIGEGVCYNCEALTTIYLPGGVKIIPNKAFMNCSVLASQLNFEKVITSIGEQAFKNCYALTDFDFSSLITNIGEEAFYNCQLLTKYAKDLSTSNGKAVLNLPATLKTLGAKAFYGCAMTEVVFAAITPAGGLTVVPESCFENCRSLIALKLVEGIVSIEKSAFSNCIFDAVTIPASVETIGDSAFSKCTGIKTVTFTDNEVENPAPSKLLTIGESAFESCISITKLELPSALTSIGKSAFSGCTSIKEIVLPSTLTSIGEKAFNGCTALTALNVTQKVETIGDSAFYGCRALGTVKFASGSQLATLGTKAFGGCTILKNVEGIPMTLTTVGEKVFYGCTQLKATGNSVAFVASETDAATQIAGENWNDDWNLIDDVEEDAERSEVNVSYGYTY